MVLYMRYDLYEKYFCVKSLSMSAEGFYFINVTSWKQLKGLKLMKDTPKIPTLPCAPCSLKG